MEQIHFNQQGSKLMSVPDPIVQIWDLEGPPGADPIEAGSPSYGQMLDANFDPGGRWIATLHNNYPAIWPLSHPYPHILRGHEARVTGVVFAPDGNWVASSSEDGMVRVWPLTADSGRQGEIIFTEQKVTPRSIWDLSISPDGRNLLVIPFEGRIVSMEDGLMEELSVPGWSSWTGAFGPRGRLVAVGGAGPSAGPPAENAVIRVWGLDSDEVRVLDPGDGKTIQDLQFLPDRRLLSASGGNMRIWDLESGSQELLREGGVHGFDLSRDGRSLLSVGGGKIILHDLQKGTSTPLDTAGSNVFTAAFNPNGSIVVAGHGRGEVSVGPVTGGDRHLLLGHQGSVEIVAVSPDGRWIASGGFDQTIRIWPMPEGKPFHTLPYDEFLDRLKALTNLRRIPDEEDPAGGFIPHFEPFPGWETVPTW
jgi:WD40 repeat protein